MTATSSPETPGNGANSSPPIEVDLTLILAQMRKYVGDRTLADFSLSLADGRALPDWLALKSSRMLEVKGCARSDIVLRMDLVYTDGFLGRFDLTIDAETVPLKLRVKRAEAAEPPRLFSEQLSKDEDQISSRLSRAA